MSSRLEELPNSAFKSDGAHKAELRFSVFDTLVVFERVGTGWLPFILGPDGKRRRAEFEVPPFVAEAELCQYRTDVSRVSVTCSSRGLSARVVQSVIARDAIV